MRVTVVVAALNEEAAIGKLLHVLGTQTRVPDEVLIADGGSTDGTLKSVASLTAALPFPVRVLHVPGRIAEGRNRAFAEAGDGVIAVTDADCVPVSGWLEALVKPIENGRAQAVAGGYYAVANGSLERAIATFSWVPLESNSRNFLPSHRSVAVMKSAWAAVGGYREDIDSGEDTRFDIEIRDRFGFVNAVEAQVAWRPRGTIRKTMWQQVFYGAGDGQARNLLAYHAAIAVFVGCELGVFCFVPWVRIASAMGLTVALLFFLAKHLRLFRTFIPDGVFVALLLAILPPCRLVGFAVGFLGLSVRGISKRS